MQDAYVDTIFSPAFRVRAGKARRRSASSGFTPPRTCSSSNARCPTALAPNRDIGVQVLGDIAGGVVSYLAGVMNGVADGASADAETNDSKDVSGRLVVRPFNKLRRDAVPRADSALGFAASRGRATGAAALPRSERRRCSSRTFRTRPARRRRRRRHANALLAVRLLFPRAVWRLGGVRRTPRCRSGAATSLEDIAHEAWQVAGSWVLTGEAATDAGAGVRPRNNFDFGNGHWGAFQIAARYHALEVDERGDHARPRRSRVQPQGRGVDARAATGTSPEISGTRSISSAPCSTAIPTGRARAENALAFRTQLFF